MPPIGLSSSSSSLFCFLFWYGFHCIAGKQITVVCVSSKNRANSKKTPKLERNNPQELGIKSIQHVTCELPFKDA